MRILAFYLLTCVLPSSSRAQDVAPPTLPEKFVGGAAVSTIVGTREAGNASIIKVKNSDQCYIISARHLLGPMGGFEKQTAASDVPTFVKSVKINFYSGGAQSYPVIPLLVPSTKLEALTGNPIDDLAVYQLKDSAMQDSAVTLSDKAPAIGDPLWVISAVAGGVPKGQIMQSLKVSNTTGFISGPFDNIHIVTKGASGAPVLNADGEVVGIYSGHSDKDGHVIGYIIPAPLILSVIQQATQAPAAN